MSQTMRKVLLLADMVVIVTGAVAPVWAADWTYVGTSLFTTAPSKMQDYKRIIFNCIAVDGMGNVYATAANGNNNGAAGGLTIYRAGGGQIDVDLNNGGAGLKGSITKMVRGGDGKIYGLQNWLEIHWSYNSGVPNRIIRIDPDGTVTPIWSPAHYTWPNDSDRIGGMDVAADGNIYWTTNSADGYWKYHYFWKFDVTQPISETNPAEAPHRDQHGVTGLVNDGMSEMHRVLDLVYVGRYKEGPVIDWFTVLGRGNAGTTAAYYADAMSWTEARGPAAPNANAGMSDPGWGRDWVTAAAYDPANKKL
ncbi:MAG: hypothetical protein ACPMAQ_12545, partial [Phycisphaerae bacterium]